MTQLDQLTVSSSPHIRTADDVEKLMWQVNLALLPAAALGVYFFGFPALAIIALAVGSAVAFEALMDRVFKRPLTVGDGSAFLTGLLLGMNLPAHVPLWMPVVGSLFAIVVVKQAFGGLGANFINPALGARAFMVAAWPAYMTAYAWPFVDGITHATPLAVARGMATGDIPGYMDMFLGNIGGVIGETSALALLAGGLFLLARGVIEWRIPAGFLGTVAFMTWFLGGEQLFTGDVLLHMLSGGLMLGAFFMATDYVTSPYTRRGKLIMGIGCGLITSIIRLWGGFPEGVTFAILFMNVATPLVDRLTVPRVYGTALHQ